MKTSDHNGRAKLSARLESGLEGGGQEPNSMGASKANTPLGMSSISRREKTDDARGARKEREREREKARGEPKVDCGEEAKGGALMQRAPPPACPHNESIAASPTLSGRAAAAAAATATATAAPRTPIGPGARWRPPAI